MSSSTHDSARRHMARMSVKVLVAALGIQLVLGAGLVLAATQGWLRGAVGGRSVAGAAAPDVPTPRANAFDGRRAWAELRREVALGPRPAGSATSRLLAAQLQAMLPHGRI